MELYQIKLCHCISFPYHFCKRHTVCFYLTQVYLGSDLWVRVSVSQSVSHTPFADLAEVTLAGEDTKSILTDNANRAIQGNMEMQVAPSRDQIWIRGYIL